VACEQIGIPVEKCADPNNKDSDGDGVGDVCDQCPNDRLRFELPCTPPPRGTGGGGGGGTEGGPCCGSCKQNSALQCRVNPYTGDCTVIDNIRCAAPTPTRPPVAPASTAPVQVLARPPSEGAVQRQPIQKAAFAPPQGPRVGKAVSDETAGGMSASVIIPLLVLIGIAVVAYLLFKRKSAQ